MIITKLSNRKFIFLLYEVLLVLLALKSFSFYSLKSMSFGLLVLISIILGFFYQAYSDIKLGKKRIYTLFMVFLYFLYSVVNTMQYNIIFPLFVVLPILFLNDRDKKKVYLFISYSIAIVLMITLIAWICYLCGLSFNYRDIVYEGRDLCDYRFFLKGYDFIPRFQSLFIEPGHVGTLCSLILYVNNYDFKKPINYIYLLSALFSLSLASYVLIVIGYIFKILISGKSKSMIVLALVCFSSLLFGLYYLTRNNEDSVLQQKIFKRLVIEDGEMAGSNRYSVTFEAFYDTMMSDVSTMIFGLGNKFNIQNYPGNAGYKIYVIENGWLATLILLFMYLSLTFEYKSMKSLGYLLLFILSFTQRAYATTYILMILYIVSLPCLNTHSLSYAKNS